MRGKFWERVFEIAAAGTAFMVAAAVCKVLGLGHDIFSTVMFPIVATGIGIGLGTPFILGGFLEEREQRLLEAIKKLEARLDLLENGTNRG